MRASYSFPSHFFAINRDLFAQSPEKYAPQYGGHCAYAVGDRARISTKPPSGEYWTVYQGKLYLFPDQRALDAWYREAAMLVRFGDKNWPNVKAQLEAN